MKILLFIHELTYSGSPNSSLRLARALKELNHNVETWSYIDGPFRIEFEKYGIKIKIVSKEELRTLKIINRCKMFDLLIANSILTCEAFEGLSSIIPSIWYIREAENIPDFFENNYKRGIVLKECKDILAVSEYAADFIKEYFNINVQVLHNCVDDVYEIYKDRSGSNDKIKIIMIGTIEQRKNFLLLIDAFLLLPQEYRKQVELHLVGRMVESERDYYINIVNKTKKNEDILFHGEIQNRDILMDLIARMDVLAVVSRDESCSLTALEGAMMAKPLLLSKNVGAKYLVDETNGWVVDTDNKDAIKEAIIKICKSKRQLRMMGEISRKRYEETSTFEIYKNNIKKLIKSKKTFKQLYYIKSFFKRLVWYYDDTDKYYKYPDWGNDDVEKHLYSYDIFDTLITRDVATPIGIFALMQKELYENPAYRQLSNYIRKNFVDLRIGAEDFARQVYCINGIEDRTLDQIYAALCANGRISAAEADILKQLEIDLEMEHCIGVAENILELKNLVANNSRVVLISDMYLSSEIIRKMLIKIDDIFLDIPIYVSSECKKSKGTTHLFKSVQSKERVSFKNWTHVGDSLQADFNSPSSIGINAVRYTGALITDIDRKLTANREKDHYVQLIAGLGRKLRLSDQYATHLDDSVFRMAQILLPFVYDILHCIQSGNYGGIYVVGDFGYIIKCIFAEAFKAWNISVIFLSRWVVEHRRTLFLPVEKLAKIILFEINNGQLSIRDFLSTFGIDDELIYNYQLKSDIKSLDIKEIDYFRFLFEDDRFLQLLREKRDELIKDIQWDTSNYIFVDLFEFSYRGILNSWKKEFAQHYFFTISDYEIDLSTKEINTNIYVGLNNQEKNTMCFLIDRTCQNLQESAKDGSIASDCIVSIPNPIIETSYKTTSAREIIKDYLSILEEKYHVEIAEYTQKTNIEYDVISFGLFETLVTFDVADKEGIYLLMKKHMKENALKYGYTEKFIDHFVSIRKEAETWVADAYMDRCVKFKSIDEIYSYIYKIANVSYKGVTHLKKYERYLIRRHTRGIFENISKVRSLVNSGKHVLVIGDTWYDYDLISRTLCDIDPIFAETTIYVTSACEMNITEPEKYFEYIQNTEKIRSNKWKHIGRELKFDVNRPQKIGIVTERTQEMELLPYEKNAIAEFQGQLAVQAIIGESKIDRSINRGNREYVIGNSLGGPMLYSYVQWVLNDAIRREFTKLLFIARDGFILKLIADIIIEKQNLGLETEYVYGSRSAWRMPSFTADDDLEIFFKMAHIDQLQDVESFSRIFKIPFLELVKYLPDEYKKAKRKLIKKDYSLIRRHLENSHSFKKFLENEAIKERQKIIRYFGDICGNKPFAFVELSGTGSTQNCLAKIMKDVTSEKIYTYFLNLDGLRQEDNVVLINYMPNNFRFVWIIENLCRAPHGQTDSYEQHNEHIIPVLSHSPEADALIEHGYISYICGVMQFASHFAKNDLIDIDEKERPIIFQKYLKHIIYNPCNEILEFIGDMPFESTGFGNEVGVFAPKLTDRQMEEIFLTRGDESIDTYYKGACLDYSIKRMSKEDREKIEHYRNAVTTKEGRKARNRKRLKEKGIVYTIGFSYRRIVRVFLLKIGLIKY